MIITTSNNNFIIIRVSVYGRNSTKLITRVITRELTREIIICYVTKHYTRRVLHCRVTCLLR